MSRFMIAGTKSGCGKTTVTCAVLSALRRRGLRPASFKCGPDYIDPMFHRQVIGVECRNLDSFFCNDDTLRHILRTGSHGCDTSVIEGVMGYYDGAYGSAWSVAQITDTPAVIVMDCKGMSDSIGAVMSGFLSYRSPSGIAGFIFDRLPLKLISLAKRLCAELSTEYLGCLPQSKVTLESRHLGLVTAAEVEGLHEKLAQLGELAEKHILLDRLLELGNTSLPDFDPPRIPQFTVSPVIAVSRDRAFCFSYAEDMELLTTMGCRLKYFSPLEDSELPESDGLILCGGYPELYAKQLSENHSMLSSVRKAVRSGMPVIAECGGFMYLHERMVNKDGSHFPMAGVIAGETFPTSGLRRFGYVTMTAREDNLLCKQGESLRAHEFHYWDSSTCGSGFTAVKKDGRKWDCGHISGTMYAGFPHFYLYGNIGAAASFVRVCTGGKNEQDKEYSSG